MKHYDKTKPISIENCPSNDLRLVDLEGEIWLDVINYDRLYSVSNLGRVKRELRITRNGKKFKPKILKPYTTNRGNIHKASYDFKIKLTDIDGMRKSHTIMSLVGEAFLGYCDINEEYSRKNKIWFDCRLKNIEILSRNQARKKNYQLNVREFVFINEGEPQPKKCPDCGGKFGYKVRERLMIYSESYFNKDGNFEKNENLREQVKVSAHKSIYCAECSSVIYGVYCT